MTAFKKWFNEQIKSGFLYSSDEEQARAGWNAMWKEAIEIADGYAEGYRDPSSCGIAEDIRSLKETE